MSKAFESIKAELFEAVAHARGDTGAVCVGRVANMRKAYKPSVTGFGAKSRFQGKRR